VPITVVGLEIAMDDARAVCGAETFEQLQHERSGFERRQPAARLDAMAQALAVEELHHHETITIGQIAQVEHLDDVIRTNAARSLRFSLEPLHGVDVLRHACMENLDGHLSVDSDVLTLVDGAHPAFAQQTKDCVLSLDDLAGL
jgi:hypothetical protein